MGMTDPEGRFSDCPSSADRLRASERPVYVLRVRAEPGVDEARALRHFLKDMLRGWGLRCLSIVPEKPQG